MQYWEIVADKLTAAGWSWGYCSAVTPNGWRLGVAPKIGTKVTSVGAITSLSCKTLSYSDLLKIVLDHSTRSR